MMSKKTYYALKTLVSLGKLNSNAQNPILIKSLLDRDHLPKKFVESILLDLKQAGLVNSKMGKGGGYYLVKPKNQIFIGFVIRLMDGPLALLPCASQTAYEPCSNCKNDEVCGIRKLFREVRDKTAEILDNTHLEKLIQNETELEILYSKGTNYVI